MPERETPIKIDTCRSEIADAQNMFKRHGIPFTLADAYTPEELAEAGETAVCAADRALSLPCYELAQQRVKAFYSGLSTTERRPLAAGLYRVYAAGVFLGIGRYDADAQEMYPEKAFPPV